MMNRKRVRPYLQIFGAFLFLTAAVFITLKTGKLSSSQDKAYCYVACGDRRIYTIDIEQGQVVAISDTISDLGNPTCIDISPNGQTLYIGSERGHWQKKYYPIVAVDLDTMKVKQKFLLELGPATDEFLDVFAVYTIRVSPDGKRLFAGYAHPKYSGGSVEIDALDGKILRHLNFYIGQGQDFMFSKDGKYVSHISQNGVETYDMQRGQQLSFKSAKELFTSGYGLNPPWVTIKTPLCLIDFVERDDKISYLLKEIERFTGKVLFEIDPEAKLGLQFATHEAPLIVSNPEGRYKLVIPMIVGIGDVAGSGYVIIFDLQTRKVESQIAVGKFPTNVVSLSRF